MTLLKAKAKINLFFHITGKREDGYHLLDSLIVFAKDIYDEIEIEPFDHNQTLLSGGEFSELLEEGNNLIDKALQNFATTQKYLCKLRKNLPIAAGLGGGSSDAAVIARFLNQNISNESLAKIGADLPVCYYQKPAYFSGIGEIIRPIENFPTIYLILVNPRKTLLTKDVYGLNKTINIPFIENKPIAFNSAKNLIDFLETTDNVLTEVAIELMPEIAEILKLLKSQNGCKIARMSGSGPTCFGVFTDREQALASESAITKLHSNYWTKYTEI